jgi:hypothetical protein
MFDAGGSLRFLKGGTRDSAIFVAVLISPLQALQPVVALIRQ